MKPDEAMEGRIGSNVTVQVAVHSFADLLDVVTSLSERHSRRICEADRTRESWRRSSGKEGRSARVANGNDIRNALPQHGQHHQRRHQEVAAAGHRAVNLRRRRHPHKLRPPGDAAARAGLPHTPPSRTTSLASNTNC